MKTKQLFAFLTLFLIISFSAKAQWQTNNGHIYFNSGYVGINTSTPGYRLDVNATMRATTLKITDIDILTSGTIGIISGSQSFEYNGKSMANYGLKWESETPSTGGPVLWASGYGGIRFFTGRVLQMTINRAGNIGIGTASPAYKVDVIGTVRAREVRVDTSGADFVFDEDYKLPSLDEVATHISEKKHLPGIPSAKEMQEEGVGLAELNTKLLQKIEELTLYIINQEKRISNLENELKTHR